MPIMITFKNGPMQGKKLSLKRSPVWLRAVVGGREPFDALDQLEDKADPSEKIFAYVMTGPPTRGFVDGTRYSGPVIYAQYAMVEPQPNDDTLRDNDRWANWVEQQVHLGNVPKFANLPQDHIDKAA